MTTAMIAAAMPAAIRPYSIAVAPRSFAANLQSRLRTAKLLSLMKSPDTATFSNAGEVREVGDYTYGWNQTVNRGGQIHRKISAMCSRTSPRLRITREPFVLQLAEIFAPIFLAIAAEFEQIVPAENPGRMQIVENQPHRVIADRMQFQNLHIALAGDG